MLTWQQNVVVSEGEELLRAGTRPLTFWERVVVATGEAGAEAVTIDEFSDCPASRATKASARCTRSAGLFLVKRGGKATPQWTACI